MQVWWHRVSPTRQPHHSGSLVTEPISSHSRYKHLSCSYWPVKQPIRSLIQCPIAIGCRPVSNISQMGSNRCSLDSQIDFSSDGLLRRKAAKACSARSSSLTTTTTPRCRFSDTTATSLSSTSRPLGRPWLAARGGGGPRRPNRESPYTASGTSSINSLFLMNRVKSFTWRLRRQLIQSAIETEAIPPDALYPPGQLGRSLDNVVLFRHSDRSASYDASAHSVKQSGGSSSIRGRHRPANNWSLSQQESRSRLRHSVDSGMPKQEIICSHDDFKSILSSSSRDRRLANGGGGGARRRNNYPAMGPPPPPPLLKAASVRRDLSLKHRQPRPGGICSFPNSMVKCHSHDRASPAAQLPRRSLSDGSLTDLRRLALDSPNPLVALGSGDKSAAAAVAALLADPKRMDEIAETDKDDMEKSLSQDSIYNFTLPNIQILGDAIQQHLKLLMGIQFGELKTSSLPSDFDLPKCRALLRRLSRALRQTTLNCCC